MDSEEYKIVYCHGRYLFPRCSVELPAEGKWRNELKEGDNVVVYTFAHAWELVRAHGRLATLATVIKVTQGKGATMAELRGERRVLILSRKGFGKAVCGAIPVMLPEDHEQRAERLRKKAQEFVFLINIPESDRLIYLVTFIQGLADISDFISHYFITDPARKRSLYRLHDADRRSRALEQYLDAMIDDLRRIHQRLTDEKNSR